MSVLEQDLRHLDDDSDEDDFVEHDVLFGCHLSMTAAASLWATSSGPLLAEDMMRNDLRLPPFIPSANLDLEHKRFMEDRAEPIFRFSKSEVEFLVCRLDIESVVMPDRCTASGLVAFCVVARRLVYPARWLDLVESFGHSQSWLFKIFKATVDTLYDKFHAKLLWNPALSDRAELFRQRFGAKVGDPFTRVCTVVDCQEIAIAGCEWALREVVHV